MVWVNQLFTIAGTEYLITDVNVAAQLAMKQLEINKTQELIDKIEHLRLTWHSH